jgi:hypothetical protein
MTYIEIRTNRLIGLLFFLIIAQSLFAQSKRMGYKALADTLYKSKSEILVFENIYFYNDLADRGAESFQSDYNFDKRSSVIEGGFQNYLKQTTSTKKWIISAKEISFDNCSFESDLRLSNTTIEGDLNFFYCRFDSTSGDYNSSNVQSEKYGGSLLLDSVIIKGNLNYWDISVSNRELLTERKRYFIKLNHSTVLGTTYLIIPKYTFQAKKSELDNLILSANDENTIVFLKDSKFKKAEIQLYMAVRFNLENCEFGSKELKDTLTLSISSEYLVLDKNNFVSPLKLFFYDVDKLLWLKKNKYELVPSIKFDAIPSESNIDLESLNHFNFNIHENFNASQDQLSNPLLSGYYKDYIKINKQLYDHFKIIGDRELADLAYIKVKDIETSMLKYRYLKTGGFNNLFAWQLNNLLKFYTHHGTNPARALVISFYILLIFAVFYFFFPSEWDIESKSKLISKYRDFIEKNSKGYFRPFIILVWNIFISFLNALTLSLNSFTTLGFGNIPTSGFARYICILQGFLGWFLLSLFTVALINQAQL